ncbi:hypothetical protein [Thermaerobacter subterraneus]|uniref:Uncharacterized protein n=1 Tax=Thermaerobacter subterraneus DSM 13965 TaxID=867903 RepID=K6PYX5_9FIRM|nr:hypothetical protein [Thermaerobacter subterraneus]EKP93754.1 hypothetical protein ThesuDRAFT_00351 [Thermaerobacter subterraneus DSM 13965]
MVPAGLPPAGPAGRNNRPGTRRTVEPPAISGERSTGAPVPSLPPAGPDPCGPGGSRVTGRRPGSGTSGRFPDRPPPWRDRLFRNAPRLVLLALALLAGWVLLRGPAGGTGPAGRLVPGRAVVRAELSFAWPEYPGRAVLTASERQDLARALARTRRAPGGRGAPPPGPHFAYWQLDWTGRTGRPHRLLVSLDGRFYDPQQGYLDRTGPLWAALEPVTRRLAADLFGEPLPWAEVDRLWPWDAVAQLRDLETGRTLRVSRYGGYQHADAEPLTREDTAVLRSLYGGSWSWRRRAVVLEVAGRKIAASINGMPHGDQVVVGNGFDGHFCVHTLASTTHVGDRVDPGHHLMVLKSSGQLAAHLQAAPPHVAATWLWVALANGDVATAAHMVADPHDPAWNLLARRLATRMQFVEIDQATTLAVQGPQARVRVRGTVYYAGDPPPVALDLTWAMTRQDGFWTVVASDVARLLPPESDSPAAPGPAAPGAPRR